jgi:sec-independent protein translocase protein TatB
MFGMGGSEILVILIVALLFLGPDKLPDAAKKISKGIRDIKRQSRALQQTIEDDEHIGGAIRDIKSALRGDEEPVRPRPIRAKPVEDKALSAAVATATAGALPEPSASEPLVGDNAAAVASPAEPDPEASMVDPPKLAMPPVAGEVDAEAVRATEAQDAELAAMVKPAPNTIARSSGPSRVAAPEPAPTAPATPTAVAAAEPAAAEPAAAETPVAPASKSEPDHG